MNPLREATPDSEALASSEDERPWPTAPSFGSLPRKENGMPGMPGGSIWASKRGSFKMDKTAQRNAAREVRVGSLPPSGLRTGTSPSPAASDAAAVLPFAIPLQPTPKAGRSMSHSQGQREIPTVFGAQSRNDHSNPHALGLVAEEIDTDSEPELGNSLTQTTSHPPTGSLQRVSTFPARFDDSFAVASEGNPVDYTLRAQASMASDHRFESAFANFPSEQSIRPQWQSRLGWDDVAPVNESRRHSLADIPTRRGSLVGNEARSALRSELVYQADQHARAAVEEMDQKFAPGGGVAGLSKHDSVFQTQRDPLWQSLNLEGTKEEELHIPDMYKAPIIRLSAQERSEHEQRAQGAAQNSVTGAHWAAGNRPRKMLFIVIFKASRPDVFYLLDNTGLDIKPGDIVIVEADRGQDLGTVQHANVPPDEARVLKRKYAEEQYKWLMMFSQHNSSGNVNPNAPTFDQGYEGTRSDAMGNASPNAQGLARENISSLKPKAVKRLASRHEIGLLSDKEGNEAKAKRTCQQKVQLLHLDMEILDAEWQWDFQKLTFYYYADHYINFKDLVTELYRIYKTRIWLSAINPASFSPNTLGQPPSGIGPGAITTHQQPAMNQSYAMSYGQDPDPYGAIPPYQIGYPTYTPNYPSIPGVPNSFPPQAMAGTGSPGPDQMYSAGHSVDPTSMGVGPGLGATQFQSYTGQRNEHTPGVVQRHNWGGPGAMNNAEREEKWPAGVGMISPQRGDAPPGWYGNMHSAIGTRPMSSGYGAQELPTQYHAANTRARAMNSATVGRGAFRHSVTGHHPMAITGPGHAPFLPSGFGLPTAEGFNASPNRISSSSPFHQRTNIPLPHPSGTDPNRSGATIQFGSSGANNPLAGGTDPNRSGATIQFGSTTGNANDVPADLTNLQTHFRNMDIKQGEDVRADEMSRER